ncbi:MAG TPA: histidine phosphatase family protein [Baekduia sp.]|uniref:histidine phosphatase family protein n=1 Tax=Baekduia sp. TaxID=2600305 RepID=UPI002BB8670D|nr:histidine phosphatase family protein [Baekduia sp.]HMJ33441.1 histidine phosphatase family protein [Baekduia sp.]
MSLRVLLICHAATAGTRHAVFGGDGPLLDGAARRLADLRPHLPKARAVLRSEAQCAAETAQALGLEAAVPDPAVADWDFGTWRGRPLADVEAEQPDAVLAWRTDPAGAPHGGECLQDVLGRVRGWLDGTEGEGTRTAVTHPAVIRAAVVCGLRVPDEAFWTIDVAPSSVTELRRRGTRWRVARINWEPALFRDPRPRAPRPVAPAEVPS